MGGRRDEHRPDNPLPEALVDTSWDPREREATAAYLEAGSPVAYQMGWEVCLICGSDVSGHVRSDGTFAWSGELGHYVSQHSLRMPRQFVVHALNHEIAPLADADLLKVEEAILGGGVDDEWWRTSPLTGHGSRDE